MPLTNDTALLQDASVAARKCIADWCWKTLREVALQGLQQKVKVVEDETVSSNRDLRIEAADIQQIQDFCLKVANRWAEKIEQKGHHETASWIRNVVNAGKEVLYESEDRSSNDVAIAREPSQQDNRINKQTMTQDDCLLAATRLKCIGEGMDISEIIEQIDKLGTLGLTEWPFDWKIIQDYASQIPDRLYRDEGDTQERLPYVGRRKRKIGSSQSIGEQSEQSKAIPPKVPAARPAFDVDRLKWRKDEGLINDSEKAKLDRLVQRDDEQQKEQSILLGGLADLGHFHFWNQPGVDGKEPAANQSKLRIRQKLYRKERLGDHQQLNEQFRRKKRISKVSLTVSPEDRHALQFDVQNFFVDVFDKATKKRRLLAFRSVEAVVEDEDRSTEESEKEKADVYV